MSFIYNRTPMALYSLRPRLADAIRRAWERSGVRAPERFRVTQDAAEWPGEDAARES